MKKTLGILFVFILMISVVFAGESSHDDFSEAIELLEQKIPYDQVTDDQFELIGDYFMELMMGDQHEFMDERMGGEGSESLRLMHINMGKTHYEYYIENGAFEEVVPMMYSGSPRMGMMWNSDVETSNNKYVGDRMMGYGYTGMGFYMGFLWLIGAIVFSAIFWLTYKIVIKK